MGVFVLLNGLAGLSSYYLSAAFFGDFGLVDFCLTWFSVFFAQVIAVELLLGSANLLYLPQITAAHALIMVLAWFCWGKKQKRAFKIPTLDFILANRILLLAAAVFLTFFAVKLAINLVNPPICPETHQYHLSFPAFWFKAGNINNPIALFGTWPLSAEMTALTYYPMNAELLFFWWLLPLKNAFLADVGQAVFYILGMLALYAILRKYAINKSTACLVSFLWVLIPNLFKQIRNGTQIDVMCAALFLMVLNYLIILSRKFGAKHAFILGVTAGIFIGTKVLNVYWLAALLPLAAYFIYQRIRQEPWGRVVCILAWVVAGFLLFGSFSYIRTFIMTGNPFYPVTIALGGKTIFPGIISRNDFSRLFIPVEFSLKDMFFSEGLGVQFIALIIPGSLVPLLSGLIFKRKLKFNAEQLLLFLLPLTMIGMYFFLIKALFVRYLFPYLGAGLLAATLFLDRFNAGKKYLTVVGLICIFASAAEYAKRQELILTFLAALAVFIGLLLARKFILRFWPRIFSLKLWLILGAALFTLLHFLNLKYEREEFNRYATLFKGREAVQLDIGRAWKWLNENTQEGKNIAYTGRSEFYPLFGSRLQNNVIYVSLNDKPPLAHHYPDGLYRKERNYRQWLNNLTREKIDYLFIALPHKVNNESKDPNRFPVEDDWAQAHPESFKPVFANSLARIYEFVLPNNSQ